MGETTQPINEDIMSSVKIILQMNGIEVLFFFFKCEDHSKENTGLHKIDNRYSTLVWFNTLQFSYLLFGHLLLGQAIYQCGRPGLGRLFTRAFVFGWLDKSQNNNSFKKTFQFYAGDQA